MTTGYAQPDGMGLDPRFRRELARKPSRRRSRYIDSLLAEIDEIDDAVRNHWHELDERTRLMFHGAVIGAPPSASKRTFAELCDEWRDYFQMAWAIFLHREQASEYFARSFGLRRIVQEKIGQDVWTETLQCASDVEAIDRGRADATAGRTIELMER